MPTLPVGYYLAMAEARERSTIRFPYGDLDDAVQVANTIHGRYGRSCTLDQLAAALDQTVSGAFRAKVATAATFGAIETQRKQITLTDLGVQLIDPQTEAAARTQAFLSVPLYQKVFDAFQGSRLPGDRGLEAELVKLGVAAKQAGKARQALQRSADQAGFFSLGRDRLVKPAASTIADTAPVVHKTDSDQGKLTDEEVSIVRHPLLVGLWERLPEPKPGALSPEEQEEWLEAARVNLRLLYGGPRKIADSSVPLPPSLQSRSAARGPASRP